MPRLLAIGLDAVSLPFLRRLVDEGTLPHTAALLRRAEVAHLASPQAFRAELPWTEFAIGRDPRAEGYWGTVAFDPEHYRVGEVGAMRARPWWTEGDAPVTIALDVPHTVLVPGAPGIQVVAWGAHSAQCSPGSEPADVYGELVARFGGHPAVRSDSEAGWHHEEYGEALTDAHERGAARRAEAMLWLLGRRPDWELAITVFPEPHTAGHTFWHGVDPTHPAHRHRSAPGARRRFHRVSAAIDAAIGRMVTGVRATLPPGEELVVVLFAVHDMEPNGSDVVAQLLLPELLHRTTFGWPLLRSAGRGLNPDTPLEVPRRNRAIGDVLADARRDVAPGTSIPPTAADLARDLMRRAARPTLRAWRAGRRRERPWYELDERPFMAEDDPDGSLSASADSEAVWGSLSYQGAAWYEPWWRQMASFVLPTFSDPHVRVNLGGREAAGIVAPDRFEAELRRVERLVTACTDARTGQPLFARCERPRPTGAAVHAPPFADLVLKVASVSDSMHHPAVGVIGPFPFLRTGEHGVNGFVAVPGQFCAQGAAGNRQVGRPADLAAVLRRLMARSVGASSSLLD